MSDIPFTHRIATGGDIAVISGLMDAAINELQKGFLSASQIEASVEVMGLDTKLIDDGTYFLIFSGKETVGCGGWSMRETLYGGDHSKGRDNAFLDPRSDAARIRAMYTHPDWARHGIGRLIIGLCETEMLKKGFKKAEMMATLSGIPLYKSCGYLPIDNEISAKTSSGISVPMVRMGKKLVA
jgi:GNAT superfamily N-acetyltransferase